MKPLSASDILRKSAPRKLLGQSVFHQNRYEHLRENSPAPSERSRLNSGASQKRKECEDSDSEMEDTCNRAKVSRTENLQEDDLVFMESILSKVSTMCGKLISDLQKLEGMEDPVRCLLADMAETIRMTNEIQDELLGKMKSTLSGYRSGDFKGKSYSGALSSKDFPEIVVSHIGKGNNPRRLPKGGFVPMGNGEKGESNFSKHVSKPAETEEEAKKRKFTEAIREAERSTLCFNLDMGNVPIMNKVTISEKASLALTKMAANKEKKGNSVPSHDAVTSIDDVMSLVTNMEFFGTTTKQNKGKGSSGFCTVPVKYHFKDRDQRVYAEKTLREMCDVKCATPYPAVVRECIRQVVDHVRLSHPTDFVKVSVVPKEFSLKISRRAPGKNLKWVDYPDLCPLPIEAWDVSTKKVPEGLRMFYLPSEGEDMLVSPSKRRNAHSPSPKTSRSPSLTA